jgi:hypothetical protein
VTESFEGYQRSSPKFKQGTLVQVEAPFGNVFTVGLTTFDVGEGTWLYHHKGPVSNGIFRESQLTEAKRSLPKDAEARKNIPLYSGLVKYFPDALIEIAKLSKAGNDQHNPGEPLHWARGKSMDQEDCLLRHLFEAGTVDVDGQLHSTKVAWRALAMLQLELEKRKGK